MMTFFAWANLILGLSGFVCAVLIMQRPALQAASYVERFSIAAIAIALGWSGVLPLAGQVIADGSKLLLMCGVSSLFFYWVRWAAGAPQPQRADAATRR